MSKPAALAGVVVCALALAGCAFGPDLETVTARADAVFDDLAAELGAVDPAVLRTVEVLDDEPVACDEDGYAASAHLARGTLSVRAEDAALDGVVDALAATLDDDEWTPDDATRGDVRAFSSDDGISVTISNARPVIVVAVFPPCTPVG